MVLTTTNDIAGSTITNYLGIVSATTYVRYNATKGMSFKDMFKHQNYIDAYEITIEETKEAAFQKLKENAVKLKANAIVGISMDVESVSAGAYTVVSIVGTAVTAS
jgi:uncharacterized protein YbjQ (UPF0145 family)